RAVALGHLFMDEGQGLHQVPGEGDLHGLVAGIAEPAAEAEDGGLAGAAPFGQLTDRQMDNLLGLLQDELRRPPLRIPEGGEDAAEAAEAALGLFGLYHPSVLSSVSRC